MIKLFGHLLFWRRAYAGERAAMRCIADNPGVLAARLLSHGQLFDDPTTSWPYLATTRMPGATWEAAALSTENKSAMATDLGRQVRRIRALAPTAEVAAPYTWCPPNPFEAARRSVLPSHLIHPKSATTSLERTKRARLSSMAT